MAFFTKLFTRKAEPYELEGRWYKTVIENDTIISSDFSSPTLYQATSAQYIMIGDIKDWTILDYVLDVEYELPAGTRNYNLGYRISSNGKIGVSICPPYSHQPYTKQTVYVLARRI